MTLLHHVGLTVGDLEVSIAFYCAVLGCDVRERSESGGPDIEMLTGVPGARIRTADLCLDTGQVLELIQYLVPSGSTLIQHRNQPGHTHVGFLVADVDAAYGRLRTRGSPPTSPPVLIEEPGSAWDGVRAIYACDPDGRTIEFLETPLGKNRSSSV